MDFLSEPDVVTRVPEVSECDSVSNCGRDCDIESRSAPCDEGKMLAASGVTEPDLAEPRALMSRTSE